MNQNKNGKRAAGVLFLLVLWAVLLTVFFTSDRSFSENENRYLMGKPEFSAQNLRSGEFMDDFETYMNDQFPLRDLWISVKTDLLRLTGRTDINGVYLGKDGCLLQRWTESELDRHRLAQNIEAIRKFAQTYKDQDVSVLVVPVAGMVLHGKLPRHAPMVDQEQVYEQIITGLKGDQRTDPGIQFIDIRKILTGHKAEYIYYRTDHHWTTYGAYLGYKQWARQSGLPVRDLAGELCCVSKDFKGSLYSRVLNRDVVSDELFLIPYPGACSVRYQFGKIQTDTLYAMERLAQKDQYQVFLNGNHPEITIETEQNNGKHLLIFKDSFANAFVPFLLSEYASIHVIDLRYFRGNLAEYIGENQITESLFLYNVKSLSEERLVF